MMSPFNMIPDVFMMRGPGPALDCEQEWCFGTLLIRRASLSPWQAVLRRGVGIAPGWVPWWGQTEGGSGAVPAPWWGAAGGSLVPVTGTVLCVPRQVSECEWGAWQGGWVRTAPDGLLQKEEIKFQIAADWCRNSDQGLSHLGDQISFTSWFCFKNLVTGQKGHAICSSFSNRLIDPGLCFPCFA